MTTIAANRECIAGDSQCSMDSAPGFLTPKLFTVERSVYGLAGDNWSNVFIDWAKTGFNEKKKPPYVGGDIDFAVLELSPTGLHIWDSHWVRIDIKNDNYAIGSGAKYAVLLMRKYNMSPKEAVEVCCEYDDYTRGPVDVMYLPKEVKKK